MQLGTGRTRTAQALTRSGLGPDSGGRATDAAEKRAGRQRGSCTGRPPGEDGSRTSPRPPARAAGATAQQTVTVCRHVTAGHDQDRLGRHETRTPPGHSLDRRPGEVMTRVRAHIRSGHCASPTERQQAPGHPDGPAPARLRGTALPPSQRPRCAATANGPASLAFSGCTDRRHWRAALAGYARLTSSVDSPAVRR